MGVFGVVTEAEIQCVPLQILEARDLRMELVVDAAALVVTQLAGSGVWFGFASAKDSTRAARAVGLVGASLAVAKLTPLQTMDLQAGAL